METRVTGVGPHQPGNQIDVTAFSTDSLPSETDSSSGIKSAHGEEMN